MRGMRMRVGVKAAFQSHYLKITVRFRDPQLNVFVAGFDWLLTS